MTSMLINIDKQKIEYVQKNPSCTFIFLFEFVLRTVPTGSTLQNIDMEKHNVETCSEGSIRPSISSVTLMG